MNLNPIENLWAILAAKVAMWTSEDGSDTYDALWEIEKQEAADLERSLLMSLIRSFPQCRDLKAIPGDFFVDKRIEQTTAGYSAPAHESRLEGLSERCQYAV